MADTLEYYYLDSTSYFGTTFEVLCPLRPDWQSDPRLKPDEVITIDGRTAGSAGCPTEKIYHACVLTKNKRLSMRDNYQRLMGFENWFDFDNQTGVTSQDTHYFGKRADTRFRLSLGRKNDFGIEIVEQIYGPTIYQDMLEQQGEGLNHIMTTLCGPEELDLITKRLESEGMPIIQDGQGSDVYYCYANTREKLAGLYVELLCPLSDRFLSDPVMHDLMVGPDL